MKVFHWRTKRGSSLRVILLYPGHYRSTNAGSGVSVVQAHAGPAEYVCPALIPTSIAQPLVDGDAEPGKCRVDTDFWDEDVQPCHIDALSNANLVVAHPLSWHMLHKANNSRTL
jgi:hypothetical protein